MPWLRMIRSIWLWVKTLCTPDCSHNRIGRAVGMLSYRFLGCLVMTHAQVDDDSWATNNGKSIIRNHPLFGIRHQLFKANWRWFINSLIYQYPVGWSQPSGTAFDLNGILGTCELPNCHLQSCRALLCLGIPSLMESLLLFCGQSTCTSRVNQTTICQYWWFVKNNSKHQPVVI